MDRCSSSSCHGNGMGSCSCGPFHGQGSSFSILFAAAAGNKPNDGTDEVDPFASSSVDCTLSLGTPSTRQTEAMYQNPRPTSSSYMSNLCWDIFQSKQTPSATPHKSGRSGSGGGDSQLVRRCANCDTTSTPLWRNGPRGPKSLCNACGIRYKKEERRATNNTTAVEAHHLMGHHHHHHHHHPWSYAGQAPKTVPTSVNGEFRLIEGDDDDGESSSPYLSWRLNVPPPDFPVHMT